MHDKLAKVNAAKEHPSKELVDAQSTKKPAVEHLRSEQAAPPAEVEEELRCLLRALAG